MENKTTRQQGKEENEMNFANEIFRTTPGSAIIATFKNGSSAEYTTNIFSLLISDPDIDYIVDAETGEVIYG